jgi:hypothetical protein
MAKYVIEIPDEVKWIQYIQQTEHGTLNLKAESVSNLSPYTEPDEDEIRQEVWEFAQYVAYHMDLNDYIECFDEKYYSYTYKEIKAKYEAWLKRKNEIHVGDEVVSEVTKTRGAVTAIDAWNAWHCVSENGRIIDITSDRHKYWKKTGRHFSEVDQLLEKMREDKED